MLKKTLFLAVSSLLLFQPASEVEAAEKLLVCGSCSREFIPEARKVVEDLQLDLSVEVGTMRCVGYCDQPAVISFRDAVYTDMNGEKIRAMLEAMAK